MLSKQGIRWPVHLTVSRAQFRPIEVIRWKITSFQMIAGSTLIFFLNSHEICRVFCRTIKILISNWPRTRKFSQLLQAGKRVAFDFARHEYALVTLFVQFLCCDWSSLTGEFMRKIYAASWILFTLTAEADRVLCQLVMFLTVFFHWDVQNEIQLLHIRSLLLFMASLFIGFLVEKYVTCQSRKSDFGWHRFRFSPCLMRKRVEKSEAILALLDSFQCISNGKPE